MTGRQRGFSIMELLLVITVALVVTAMATPTFISTLRNYRISGDGRVINGEVLTAKMRAASYFTRARVYADLSAQTYRIEICTTKSVNSCTAWTTEGGTIPLSSGVSFGYGTLATPPTGTQAALEQAPQCLDGTGTAIANTACVVFNSRGIPIDNSAAPTANDALYITDGNAVYGVTISATGLTYIWRSPAGAVSWQRR